MGMSSRSSSPFDQAHPHNEVGFDASAEVFIEDLFLATVDDFYTTSDDSILEEHRILPDASAVEEESILTERSESVNESIRSNARESVTDTHHRSTDTKFSNVLHCFSTNADCLTNKIDEVKVLLAGEKPDIMIITEVCAKNRTEATPVVSLMCQGYDLFTNELEKRGIAMYVKKSLKANVEDLNMEQVDEALWCSIKLRGSDKLLVGAIYRSPSSSEENNKALMKQIKTCLERRDFTHYVITGDFNLRNIDWETWSIISKRLPVTRISRMPWRLWALPESILLHQNQRKSNTLNSGSCLDK